MTTPGRRFTRWDKAKANGRTDAQLAGITDTAALLARSSREADLENLSKVQNSRPLKPPTRRQP